MFSYFITQWVNLRKSHTFFSVILTMAQAANKAYKSGDYEISLQLARDIVKLEAEDIHKTHRQSIWAPLLPALYQTAESCSHQGLNLKS